MKQSPTQFEQQIERLTGILSDQLQLHQTLLQLMQEKRIAIREADLDRIEAICEREQELTHNLGELEKQRLTLVGELTEALDPKAQKPMTVSQIVRHCEPENGEELSRISDALREAIANVSKQSAILRQAADALAQHMSGIAHTIQNVLSRAVVYGSGGTMQVSASGPQRLDIKS